MGPKHISFNRQMINPICACQLFFLHRQIQKSNFESDYPVSTGPSYNLWNTTCVDNLSSHITNFLFLDPMFCSPLGLWASSLPLGLLFLWQVFFWWISWRLRLPTACILNHDSYFRVRIFSFASLSKWACELIKWREEFRKYKTVNI